VVAAYHLDLERRVALKLLLPEMLGAPGAVARFLREAKAAVKIESEHVARVLDVGMLPSGAPYMVMEFLEGGDLTAWLKQRGPLPIEQTVDFVLQACVGAAEAHGVGIVHRDLKPANLFCVRRSDGQLIIKVRGPASLQESLQVIREDNAARRARQFASILWVVLTLGASAVARADDIDACIAASENALSLHKAQKLLDARVALSTCAASSCPAPIRASCQQRLAPINLAIPSIVFVARDRVGHDLDAVKLTIDGTPFADHLTGTAIEMDPGEHEFRFEVEGQEPVVRRLVVRPTEQNRRESILIGPSAGAVAPAESSETAAPPGSSAGTEGDGGTSPGTTQRTLGVVVGSAGVVALGVGAVSGILALSAHNSYEHNCGSAIGAPAGACNEQGVQGPAPSTLPQPTGAVAATGAFSVCCM
jgi:hypothetical protein